MESKSVFAMATISRMSKAATGQRVLQTGQFQVAASVAVIAGSAGRTINATGHGARVNDRIVFITGALQYEEFTVTAVPNANSLEVDYTFQGDAPIAGDDFKIMRPVTAAYNSDGELTVSSGPIAFRLDGVATTVSEDTGTPANSIPLPVKLLDENGLPVVFSEPTLLLAMFVSTASTVIPASSGNPVQLIASTSATYRKIQWQDDIGEFIGVYTGAALSETLLCLIGPGGSAVTVAIPAGTRISLRNMKNEAIASGLFANIQFLG